MALEEELYMHQPTRYVRINNEHLVWKLRQWYIHFNNFMEEIGFKRCHSDFCCFIKRFEGSSVILLLYVDDILIVGADKQKFENLKRKILNKFEINDLGVAD